MEAIRLRDKQKLLKPQAVVDAARPESSPLHKRFEWDDSVAGEKYRIEQARRLIVSYRIEIPDVGSVQQFISLPSDRVRGGGGYRPMIDVMNNARFRAMYLEDALRELQEVQKKYKRIEELAGVWEAVGKVKNK